MCVYWECGKGGGEGYVLDMYTHMYVYSVQSTILQILHIVIQQK